MTVLVACEFSGAVRRAFRALGHDAWSCDVLPAEDGDFYHLQRDVLTVLDGCQAPDHGFLTWDLMVAHPPCTHLAVSGSRWFAEKRAEQADALAFVQRLMDAPIAKIAVENPVSVISTRIRKPDQIIQPWQFGHGETKTTCLWLKNLPKLAPTNVVDGRHARVHRVSPSPDRWKKRSRTYEGIAAAMAAQWGCS
jgi:hypothetical protein